MTFRRVGSDFGGIARVLAVITAVTMCTPASAAGRSSPHPLHVYLFWTESVSFSVRANAFLTQMAASDPDIRLDAFDVNASADNLRLFERILVRIGTDVARVPFTIIGSEVFVGFESDEVTGAEFVAKIEECRRSGCPDRLFDLLDLDSPEVVMGHSLAPLSKGFTTRASRASALLGRR